MPGTVTGAVLHQQTNKNPYSFRACILMGVGEINKINRKLYAVGEVSIKRNKVGTMKSNKE